MGIIGHLIRMPTTAGAPMMRKIFINQHDEWRIPWRILAMFMLLAGAMFAINRAWRAAGMPGQRTSTDAQFLGFTILIVAATVAIIIFLLRAVEKRSLDAIWLPLDASALKLTVLGTLLGCLPIALLVGASVLGGYGDIAAGSLSSTNLATMFLPALGAVLLLAGWEELVVRGYLFRQLALVRGPLFAAIITGILFGLMHSGNPGANWQGLVFTALGGFLMGLLLMRSGSLWLLIGYHFGWNACSGNLFGLAVSGMDVDNAIWRTTLSGSDWLTGGSYGFESSLPAVVSEIVVLGGVLIYLNKKRPEPALEL